DALGDASYTVVVLFFFSSRRRHTRFSRDWSSDVCSSDLCLAGQAKQAAGQVAGTAAEQARTVAGEARRQAGSAVRDLRGRAVEEMEERRVGKECRARGSP